MQSACPNNIWTGNFTAQKMKFSVKNFFSKCDRILSTTKSIQRKSYARHGLFLQHLKQKSLVILVKGNIDKNVSANLMHSHYHGTSISLLQLPECKSQRKCLLSFEHRTQIRKVIPIAIWIYKCRKSSSFFLLFFLYSWQGIYIMISISTYHYFMIFTIIEKLIDVDLVNDMYLWSSLLR